MTKTKASHHKQTNRMGEVVAKQQGPVSSLGIQVASEVQSHNASTAEVKARLILEIMEHEDSHGGLCTQTFVKKIRKQVKPRV